MAPSAKGALALDCHPLVTLLPPPNLRQAHGELDERRRGAMIVSPLTALMSTMVDQLNERAAAEGMSAVAGLATNPQDLRRFLRGDVDILLVSPEFGVQRRRSLLAWASRRAASDTPQRTAPLLH